MKYFAYIHSRPSGEPFYVGKGCRGRHRLFSRVRNPHYANVVEKYGASNIIVQQIFCEDEDQAFALERFLICSLRSLGALLTNQSEGGEGLSNPTANIRAVLSEKTKARMALLESKAAVSRVHKGKVVSEATRKRISKATKEAMALIKSTLSAAQKKRFADGAEGAKHSARLLARAKRISEEKAQMARLSSVT